MTSVYEDFLRKLNEIHGGRQFHSFDDFMRIFDTHKATLDDAFNATALYPFNLSAKDLFQTMNTMKDRLSKLKVVLEGSDARMGEQGFGLIEVCVDGYNFKFKMDKYDAGRAVTFFDENLPMVEYNITRFAVMRKFFFDYITLDVLPNPFFGGECVYLEEGKVIMPNRLEYPGYHVFNVSILKCGCCNEKEVDLSMLTKHGLGSLEEAIKLYVNPEVNQTIVVAGNTEYIPLLETAVPIVEDKYLSGLRAKDYS